MAPSVTRPPKVPPQPREPLASPPSPVAPPREASHGGGPPAPRASASTGPVAPTEPVHARSGERRLHHSHGLFIRWRAEGDGDRVSGAVWFEENRAGEQVYALGLPPAHHHETFYVGPHRTKVEVLLRRMAPYAEGEPARAELFAFIQLDPHLVHEVSVATWHLGAAPRPVTEAWRPPAGVIIDNPAAPLEIFTYLVTHVHPRPATARAASPLVRQPWPTAPASRPVPVPPPASTPASGEACPPPASPTASPEAPSADAPATEDAEAPAPAPPSPPTGEALLECLHAAWRALMAPSGTREPAELVRAFQEAVAGHGPGALLASEDVRRTLEEVWPRLAALVVKGAPGDAAEAERLTRALQVRDVLARLEAGDASLTKEEERRQALTAPVVLPEALLPEDVRRAGAARLSGTSEDTGSGGDTDSGWVRLLGLGLLRTLRQRLLRYAPGDIAYTLNLMPGEKRVLTERWRLSTEWAGAEREREDRSKEKARQEHAEVDLRSAMENLVASGTLERDFTNLNETYGANGLSLTVTGSWTDTDSRNDTLKSEGLEAVSRAVDLATRRLDKRLERMRELHLVQEAERVERFVHDNRRRDSREVGIYHWLNKVYSLCVAERGARLVIEFLVADPAAPLYARLGLPPPPPSPESLFPGLSAAKLDAQAATALATLYAVDGVTPPAEPPEGTSDAVRAALREAWGRRTYEALLEGYWRCLGAWRERCELRLRELPADLRALEQEALKAGCLPLLLALAQPGTDAPELQRFFDVAFEWRDMAYRFYPWGTGGKPSGPAYDWVGEANAGPDADTLFRRFLTAGSARVLVPVAPAWWVPVLYYFYFGEPPPWGTGQVPLPEPLVALLSELLEAMEHRHGEGPPWTVEVPTALLYLQEGSALPGQPR